MKKLIAVCIPTLLLSACVIHVGHSSATENLQHEQRQLQLSAAGLSELKAETEAGDLKIVGVKGASQIEVTADIYSSDSRPFTLSLEKQGSAAVLKAVGSSCFGICTGSSAYADLVVTMPAELALALEDGSGDIHIEGLSSDLVIEDGSGNLTVQGGRHLVLEDGSGNVSLTQLSGNVTVEDGSGDLFIQQVAGTVLVEDGSGDIDIQQVKGMVTISDGSGDIRVQQAGGFTLLEDGSGELKIDQINGPVSLNKD
ncbi:hypothetical protein Rhein_3450 [Rheinheimera sp. A13L]|uniref:DUF4097 family beta strand repeat-containing protein n=1 Tax=Rheinheimera sp. A13L TaxID=506534 RepID=UPI0002124C45|nr:DUF4097 family beta strand repeat-containing protein [Rheinheimera sp. A13L]EGM76388.1 hypothetical protein Rhein_3450 [Rheinheimera sp. A13L]